MKGLGCFVVINNQYGYLLTRAHLVCRFNRKEKAESIWLHIQNFNGSSVNRFLKLTQYQLWVDGLSDLSLLKVPLISSKVVEDVLLKIFLISLFSLVINLVDKNYIKKYS